jgi:hypothetical protein
LKVRNMHQIILTFYSLSLRKRPAMSRAEGVGERGYNIEVISYTFLSGLMQIITRVIVGINSKY